ncbi:MAG: sulfatase [Pseudomonadota bacterium]
MTTTATASNRWRSWSLGALCLVAATLVLHLVLIQPNHPAAMTWGALRIFALELPVIVLALIALPARSILTQCVRAALALSLTVIAALKFADFLTFTALSRGFNPVSDLTLIHAAFRLASGTFGEVAAVALSLGLLAAVVAVAAVLWWATGVWARLPRPRGVAWGTGALAFGVAVLAIIEIGGLMGRWPLPFNPPGAAFTARVGAERVALIRTTLADLRAFDAAAREDAMAGRPGLFARLDRDLIIVYIESYGRGALDNPRYADRIHATLDAAGPALSDAGLAVRTGWLDAPTRGGQSWLTHMSLASGMRIDGQSRYAAALASNRATLFDHASAAGLTTVAVMPAITLPWPESAAFGFDRVYAAADLGYEGLPFNWVTMPDQFTLHALDTRIRPEASAPIVAQVALISSHAPWVPVPDILDWNDIGDGSEFDGMATAGDPPEVVWRDRDRVRTQYGLAVDYALRVALDWAARQRDEAPLMLILGDHQPAEFVAGDRRPDVPAHLIGPAELVDGAASWGWTPGMVPDPSGPVDGMETMRDRLIALVSTAAQRADDSASATAASDASAPVGTDGEVMR